VAPHCSRPDDHAEHVRQRGRRKKSGRGKQAGWTVVRPLAATMLIGRQGKPEGNRSRIALEDAGG